MTSPISKIENQTLSSKNLVHSVSSHFIVQTQLVMNELSNMTSFMVTHDEPSDPGIYFELYERRHSLT
jgi:hypothetical protein